LETAVWDTVTGLLKRPELLVQELEHLTQPNSVTREALQLELAQVTKRLHEILTEERRLVEGYRKGFYADFMMREETQRIREEQASAERRHAELECQLTQLDKALGYRGQVEELARRLSQGLDQMSFVERRELLQLLVDQVVYDDGKATMRTIIPLGEGQLHPVPQGVRERGIGLVNALHPECLQKSWETCYNFGERIQNGDRNRSPLTRGDTKELQPIPRAERQ
jgi:hypothetical protein